MNFFLFLRILSLISKGQKENIICTMDDVRGDFLGPPHGATPAAVRANKNINLRLLKSIWSLLLDFFLFNCIPQFSFFLFNALSQYKM